MEVRLDKAICLCLDKRQEHWEDLKEQCESRGIEFIRFLVGKGEIFPEEEYDYIDDPNPNVTYWRYGAPDAKKNHYNAFMSHQGMLRYAIDNNLESVLFLEDDAYFTERFEDVFSKVKDTLEPVDWDIVYFGWWIGHEGDGWNSMIEDMYNQEGEVGIGRVGNAHSTLGGLHAALINKSMFKKMASLSPLDCMDSLLNRMFHQEINSYYICPKIIHDKGIFSEAEQNENPRLKL